MVVAELFVAQAGTAATMAIDKDVAATIAFELVFSYLGDLVWHGVSPSVLKVLKSSKEIG
ncbi:hypothetical protein P8936_10680 [Edaphobacter paludis]|uniref:Uncharacterized protein n=1 Tax=Edaphobacter paludis TaxID=3035702 RepID=A0AAU7D4I5_9BACT